LPCTGGLAVAHLAPSRRPPRASCRWPTCIWRGFKSSSLRPSSSARWAVLWKTRCRNCPVDATLEAPHDGEGSMMTSRRAGAGGWSRTRSSGEFERDSAPRLAGREMLTSRVSRWENRRGRSAEF
jgi:hypothetical protein